MKFGLLLLSALLVFGCSSQPVTEMPKAVDDVVAEYKMGVGDRVSVQV